MNEDQMQAPFTPWLESVVKDIFEIMPECIAFQMRDADNRTYTSYFNCSLDDMTIMADAVQKDGLIAYIHDNREDILTALNEDDDDDEDETDDSPDTEADSEG